MHNAFQGVKAANVEWRELTDNTNSQSCLAPYSPDFDDVYFNTKNGIAESRYVFLAGNKLAQRFSDNHADFTIFETGFGTGLNFLLTCELWQQQNTQGHLHYYSVEQFPINRSDLEKIYAQLQLDTIVSNKLLNDYPPILQGIYPIQIAANITLHLIFYPLETALKEVAINDNCKVDAWYLDGFAPSKNPQMWHKGLWHFMALHAINNDKRITSLATFTAASKVRRMLQHYGFNVIKRKGFGHKREMLTACFVEKQLSIPRENLASPYLKSKVSPKKVAVIGAGLAGCSLIYALRQKNIHCELFEQGDTIAAGASKMPALLASPNFSIDHNSFSQLTFSGFYRLQQLLKQVPELVDAWQALQLTCDKYSEYQLKQYLQIYQSRLGEAIKWQQASGDNFQNKALKIPALQVNGYDFCHYLLKDLPQEHLHLNQSIRQLNELKDFSEVVLCTGHQSLLNSLGLENLPTIMPLRGQLTAIEAPHQLRQPLNYDGHLLQHQQRWFLGATFENSDEQTIKPADDLSNIAIANQKLGLNLKTNKHSLSYVGIRASSYDRFPFCGLLQADEKQSVWLNYGYGTRGLCLSLTCAEILAASINNQNPPIAKSLLQKLNPARLSIKY